MGKFSRLGNELYNGRKSIDFVGRRPIWYAVSLLLVTRARRTWVAEDSRGLYARGRLMLDIARGREIHSLMCAGAVDGLSIGFRAVKARRDRISGVRRLEKIDLWEISVVTFPMLPEARVAVVKQQPPSGDPNADAILAARLAAVARLLRSTNHPQRTCLT